MEPNGLLPTRLPGAPQAGSGEIIFQNGRHSGSSRPLGVPLTFIGSAAGCDIRLNAEDIDPLHCLLVGGPEGLILRDLDSGTGTLVNGLRVSHVALKDGDTFAVGTFQFRLRLPTVLPVQADSGPWDPVRVQSAAVAAQQAALTEEEIELAQRRVALENQEEQLAAHLEDKRQRLLQLSERAQAERSALEKDRTAYEQNIEKITGDMTEAQREILKGQQKIETERKRLKELQRRLRQRWHRFWLAERQKLERARAALEDKTRTLDEQTETLQDRDQDLTAKRLRFNTEYELGRCRLREAWQRLHQDQYRWKHRRGKERAALKRRERATEAAEMKLLEAQRLFLEEQRAWESEKSTQRTETAGLETRIKNQREKIVAQEQEIARLDAEILIRRQTVGQDSAPDQISTAVNKDPAPNRYLTAPAQERSPDLQATRDAWQKRFLDLNHLAGELADQRSQLVEQWQRLTLLKHNGEADRHQAGRELEELAQRLSDSGHQLAQREQACRQADQVLRRRHEELLQVRQQMIAWGARLRLGEKDWEAERQRLLLEVKNREELAERHLNALVELRRRWTERRGQELSNLRTGRQALEAGHRENNQQRLLLVDQTAAVDADKRILSEKSLALEQYRQEVLGKQDNSATDRRLERLRRRWITLNASAIRAASRERESLKTVLQTLEVRFADLQTRADMVAQSEANLIENQTAWEHKQTLAIARQTRLQFELQNAEAQRNLADQQVARMRDEIERIARSLIDQPDPPFSDALNHAA